MTDEPSARAEAERVIASMDSDWSDAVEIVAALILRERARGMREIATMISDHGRQRVSVTTDDQAGNYESWWADRIEHRARETEGTK
jgi:succinate dehydrogenase flavin-adding protein (antitoxin of CptAB toxin-antitoxin module)